MKNVTKKSKAQAKPKNPTPKAKKEAQQQGHTVPPVETPIDQSAEKLARIAETLMKNLDAIPMRQWQEPIMSALKSAYLVGQATPASEEGEDRALNSNVKDAAEGAGFDCIERLAALFGDLTKTGMKAGHIGMRLMEFPLPNGNIAYCLLPTVPPVVAKHLQSLTAAPAA